MGNRRYGAWPCNQLAAAVLLASGLTGVVQADEAVELEETKVIATAQEELKQAPGVSVISAEDIRKRPPTNDISEIIRTMPGVNLTGNSTSGQRGNNRQIDIRGMGPENTLILIDGKPVASRNSVRMGWRGERDSRGDTNWVPADQIERIEVLRGPAAARYGSGAAGGVVNIITKQPTDKHSGTATIYANMPQHSEEGATRRMTFGLSGPLAENLSYRLYGNVNKTDSDDQDINEGHESLRTGVHVGSLPAGREGTRNRDVNGLLEWRMTPEQTVKLEAGFSRQGNIYTGDTQNTNTNGTVSSMLARETNTLYRQSYSITHEGDWAFGSTLNYLQYENTRNDRLNEGLAGGTEGIFANVGSNTIELKNLTAHSEVNLPLSGMFEHVLTLGAEWTEQRMEDPSSNTQTVTEGGSVPGLAGTDRSVDSSARIASLFWEDNIEVRPGTTLTPGLRFDHHSQSGSNWSPALNLSHKLTDTLAFKAGIARAYKAPNLYQSNPDYLLYSRGQGCWGAGGSCYLMGNENLKAETSVNKELGLEFSQDGLIAGLTWFRNDYRNKIEAGTTAIGSASGGTGSYAGSDIFQWHNVDRAVVEGLEGTLTLPLSSDLSWSNNFTYMLKSQNKDTGDRLSIIPRYTINSTLDWQATEKLSLQASTVYYGKQQPKKLTYQGLPATGSETREISPYAIAGVSGTYAFSDHLSLTAGVSNLFDKRLYREGNSQSTGDSPNVIYGAGAHTYNEPGRTFYTSVSTSF
ncbi:TonB-dependent siderophore receptor [Pseudomonas daroniae]|nr:TonB-dependent siderophore receptor [Pseudomonas daroniae]